MPVKVLALEIALPVILLIHIERRYTLDLYDKTTKLISRYLPFVIGDFSNCAKARNTNPWSLRYRCNNALQTEPAMRLLDWGRVGRAATWATLQTE